MEEQNTISSQKAFVIGKVKEGHYFSVQYPDGREVLFRLAKKETGEYVLRGMRTTVEILLEGKEGYDKLFELADAQAKKEYSFPAVFEDVHACWGSKKEYEVHSYDELRSVMENLREMYNHPDDREMSYFIASRCVCYNSTRVYFNVFVVYRGNMSYNWLYDSYGNSNYPSKAVRPEATLKSDSRILTEGRDGSKEKPWSIIT